SPSRRRWCGSRATRRRAGFLRRSWERGPGSGGALGPGRELLGRFEKNFRVSYRFRDRSTVDDIVVGSSRGAVQVFRPARFLDPPPEPGVPVARHRALRKSRRIRYLWVIL